MGRTIETLLLISMSFWKWQASQSCSKSRQYRARNVNISQYSQLIASVLKAHHHHWIPSTRWPEWKRAKAVSLNANKVEVRRGDGIEVKMVFGDTCKHHNANDVAVQGIWINRLWELLVRSCASRQPNMVVIWIRGWISYFTFGVCSHDAFLMNKQNWPTLVIRAGNVTKWVQLEQIKTQYYCNTTPSPFCWCQINLCKIIFLFATFLFFQIWVNLRLARQLVPMQKWRLKRQVQRLIIDSISWVSRKMQLLPGSNPKVVPLR